MIILDTDCISLLERSNTEARILTGRLEAASPDEIATTIVNFEEQMRGWLAYLARARTVELQVAAYDKLCRFLDNYRTIPVLPFNEEAATHFRQLRKGKIRIGTMDLRIASIALAHNALLITRNLSDFEQVPRLRLADWTR
jgi:tRNA(fMet)-specific endonuclease VapC